MQEEHYIQQIIERKVNLFGHLCRMKDNRPVKEASRDVWNNGWSADERKTLPRMVRRHQGVGWRRNSHTHQEGAGSRHVENGGADGIGHLRAVSHA